MGTAKPKLLNDLVDLENIRIEQVFENLRCDKEGLSYTDAKEGLSIYGHNKLEEKTEQVLKIFEIFMEPSLTDYGICCYHGNCSGKWRRKASRLAGFFLGIITFLILTSSAYSCAVDRASDITARAQLPKFSRVLRVGQGGWCEVYSSNLVPEDIISIKMGDIVPADAPILEYCTAEPVVKIDQSDLTGESHPITKSRPGDCVYSGSTCQQGEIIKAVVIATGVHTRYRNAASAHAVDSSNQVKCFQRVSKSIGNFCIFFVAVVMTVEIIVMYCMQHRAYRSGIDNLLVLLIGGIPIGMPLSKKEI